MSSHDSLAAPPRQEGALPAAPLPSRREGVRSSARAILAAPFLREWEDPLLPSAPTSTPPRTPWKRS